LTTTTQRKKLSKSAYLLIFLLIGAIIVVSVLAFLGKISLQFLADGIVGYHMAGSMNWVMGALTIVLPFVGGILFFYFIKVYFIGNKTTGAVATGGYAPTPYTPSATNKDTETVIS
jgi:hypothetical protein